ncbi:MAG: hypothetical protein DIZ80_12475 [endosymbiont of Galathealinum brachiosum]|uniref:diguanylate cyclase n=1 Tax=endosymbiont of Galathealinum brachiosum TaxID=2200906 RepID=A0A370DDT7_9GAMM|nr:MAG: hypothetical protein DIZ80_12475 [endosymbiont of Galathealinum brachiosum]
MLSSEDKKHLRLFIIYILISVVSFTLLTIIHSWITFSEIHIVNFVIPTFASTVVGFVFARNKILQSKLIKLAITDKLTGASNRLYFDRRLRQEIDRAKRYKQHFSIIYLDIDYFKRVNDRHGHGIGDEALKDFSLIASNINRDSDVFARFGGEEFIILASMTDKKSAYSLYLRIKEAIEKHEFKQVKNITFSAGITEFDLTKDNADRILERADKALYEAKEKGRNQAIIAE